MMKPFLMLLLVACLTHANAQQLSFDKRFVESEDKWVAFPADSSKSYAFGFIYIDPQAGLTFDYQGSFKIDSEGKFLLKKKDANGSMKYRLEPNQVKVAFIPESKFKELEVAHVPDWLKAYKVGEKTAEWLYRRGYMYNAWGECEKALSFLQQAAKINNNYSGLGVELAYSYNCLKRYDEAIAVLKETILANPTDAYVNKEYVFSLAKKGALPAAEEAYRQSVKNCTNKTYQAENAFNILQAYFMSKDFKNFDKWLAETDSVYASNTQIKKIVDQMKVEAKR